MAIAPHAKYPMPNVVQSPNALLLNALLLARRLVVRIWQVKMSLGSLRCEDHHANDATGAAVPFDRFP